ncbi:MAG: FRG domain-containing protein [Anaerolineales bacterium]|nr:MAG: FRG domain-containing protein [Anaerolineales bacterium]
MLEIRELNHWDEFERAVRHTIIEDRDYDTPRYTIFRGQPDAKWHLRTTLERMVGGNMQAENYFRLIESIQTQIETFINQRWELPDYEDFQKNLTDHHKIDEQTFFYMTYLRHFGFPSPLLDWTRSPFVAAYFAFRDASSSAEKVAVYMYSISMSDAGVRVDQCPYVSLIDKSPRNNKRHELQQGVYTICLKEENERIYFSDHEEGGVKDEHRIPFVTKFILPASERLNAFCALQTYNINPYSLFGTEESLLESLFFERYRNALLNKMAIENRARKFPGHDNIDANDINSLWW